jgi:hypothetical protein
MPFVNHDSDKSKFRDRSFFQKISKKKHRIYRKILIASPKGEANNRIRRKIKAMSLCMYVCVYVPLHSSGVLRQISDFLVLKITQKICGATRTKIISFT